MNDDLKPSKKNVRRSKVKTDERGRSVWDETVNTANLELVSTQMLEQLIETNDGETQDQLRELSQGADGVLARDADEGRFEIISEEELQHIVAGSDLAPKTNLTAATLDESAEDAVIADSGLDLVSTQMLRTILDPDDNEPTAESGFDPYDHS